MTVGSKCRWGAIAVIAFSACMGSSRDPKTPSPQEQSALNAQFDRVFANVPVRDAVDWQHDQEAVRQLHLFAYWIHRYHEYTQSYPMADRLDELNFVQCFVYGDDTRVDYSNPVNQKKHLLLAQLREVLGMDLELPLSPRPADWRGLHYSTNGLGFTVAVDLAHAVNGSEVVVPGQCQYRVASYEGASIPIHSLTSILEGRKNQLEPAVWRDPSVQTTR